MILEVNLFLTNRKIFGLNEEIWWINETVGTRCVETGGHAIHCVPTCFLKIIYFLSRDLPRIEPIHYLLKDVSLMQEWHLKDQS